MPLPRKVMGVQVMNEKREEADSDSIEAVSGLAARRSFIKSSGRVAIAAPAVLLLLSAASKSAVAGNYGHKLDPSSPGPRTGNNPPGPTGRDGPRGNPAPKPGGSPWNPPAKTLLDPP